MNDRQYKKTVLVLISLFIFLHFPLLVHTVSHSHSWRQADTAAVSRNFYEESFNFFYPRVDARGELSGITGMEFPMYQYLSGILYFVFDTDVDIPGKLISLVSSVVALIFLIALAASIDKTITASSIVIVYLTSPFVFFFATSFMPELFALSLALAGVYFFTRYEQTGQTNELMASILFLCLASLSRPFLIFLCYPLVHTFVADVKKGKFNRGVFLGGTAILAAFAFWYFYWSPYLVRKFGLDIFFFGSDLHHNLATMSSFSFWSLLLNEITTSYLGWIWLPFTVHGSCELFRKGNRIYRYFLLAGLIGIVVLGLVSGRHFSPHYYYLICLLPLLVISSAFSLEALCGKFKVNRMALGIALILIIFLIKIRIYREDRVLIDTMASIQQATAKKDLVVVETIGGVGGGGAGNSYSLHHLRRKGWIVTKEEIAYLPYIQLLHDEGARWVIPLEKGNYCLYPIAEWEKKIAE